MTAVLVVALLAPLAALVPAIVRDGPGDPLRWFEAGLSVAAISWLVVLAGGGDASIGSFHVDPAGAAAGVGIAVVAAAGPWRSVERDRLVMAVAAAALAAAGVAGGTAGTASVALAGAILATAVVLLRSDRAPLMIAGAGASVMLGAALLVRHRTGSDVGLLPGALALVGAALVGVAAGRPGSRAALVVPAALVFGVRAAGTFEGGGAAVWTAAIALLCAAAAVSLFDGDARAFTPVIAIAGLGVAALPIPGAVSAALLLASGAVLALVTGGVASALLALPGAVALAHALAFEGGFAAAVAGTAAFVAAAGLALRRPTSGAEPELSAAGALAAALALWLLLAPGTWGWVGPVTLQAYDEGAAIGLAAGLVAVLADAVRRRGFATTRWYALLSPPELPPSSDGAPFLP